MTLIKRKELEALNINASVHFWFRREKKELLVNYSIVLNN